MIGAMEHVAIAAENTEALARWYCDTLGFRVVVAGRSRGTGQGLDQGTWFVGPAGGGTVLEIMPARAEPRAGRANNDPGLSHIAFTVGDFDAACETLRRKGVQFTGDMTGVPGERRLAFFTDPEGNLLQLAYRPQPLGS